MTNLPFRRGRGQYVPNLPSLRRDAARVAERQGPVMIEPSQPGQLGPDLGTYIRLPGANFAPAGAIPLDVIGDANLAPGASGTLITVTVADTLRLRMDGIGFTADDDIALGYLTWAILAGPDPVPSYSQMQAAVGSVRQLSDIFVLVGSSQTMTVRATISALAPITYRYICRVHGWFYSEKESG
jgi:hypothetical protein